jgi:quinol monooxygenase YgiN
MSITNVAFIRAKPGQGVALGRLLAELAPISREEAGCIDFELHRSVDNPDLWFVYENWTSRDDLDQHFKTAHLLKFVEASAALLDGDMDLRLFSKVAVADAKG